jgi:hypothetical protein
MNVVGRRQQARRRAVPLLSQGGLAEGQCVNKHQSGTPGYVRANLLI